MIGELHGEYIILLIGYLFGIAVMALYVVAFVNSWFSLRGTVCMTIGVCVVLGMCALCDEMVETGFSEEE